MVRLLAEVGEAEASFLLFDAASLDFDLGDARLRDGGGAACSSFASSAAIAAIGGERLLDERWRRGIAALGGTNANDSMDRSASFGSMLERVDRIGADDEIASGADDEAATTRARRRSAAEALTMQVRAAAPSFCPLDVPRYARA